MRRHYLYIAIALFLISAWLISLMGCAQNKIYRPVCRNQAFFAASTVHNRTNLPVRIVEYTPVLASTELGVVRPVTNHVQAQVYRNGKWRWLKVITKDEISEMDSPDFMVMNRKYYTFRIIYRKEMRGKE